LTLGQVYDLDLKKNETLIKDVIIQAQGEMALEEFMKSVRLCTLSKALRKPIDVLQIQVRETWTTYTLDLVNYQNKCRLIRYIQLNFPVSRNLD
jgi:dynein heavy chain 1, cytosolic